MVFTIDYEKVSEVGNVGAKKTLDINNLYSDIIDICSEINDNWQSKDSSIYMYHFASFLEKKMKENDDLNTTFKALMDISSVYSEQDNKWLRELINTDVSKGRVD